MARANLLSHKQVEKADSALLATAAGNMKSYLRDGDGLFVRLYPNGRKSFVFRYEIKGRTKKVQHPKDFPELSLEEARKWRNQQRALLDEGKDPVATKTHGRAIVRAMLDDSADYPPGSFGDAARKCYAVEVQPKFDDPEQWWRIVERDLLPGIGKRPIGAIDPEDVQAAVLLPIIARGSPVAANRALLAAKKIFRYGKKWLKLQHNPLAEVTRADVGGKEGQRERALSWDELEVLWPALEAHTGISWQVRACLKFLLLTGQRIGETLQARWRDVDVKTGIWNLPPETTKMDRAHLVHLPSLAVELLTALPGDHTPDEFIFHAGDSTVTRRAVTRALDRMLTGEPAALPLEHFTPHDLRRTVRSRLSDIGVAPHVAEKILAHKLGGVLQVYDRADYLPERAAAMAAWDSKLRELLAVTQETKPARKRRSQVLATQGHA